MTGWSDGLLHWDMSMIYSVLHAEGEDKGLRDDTSELSRHWLGWTNCLKACWSGLIGVRGLSKMFRNARDAEQDA